MSVCERCGYCCHYVINGNYKACKYLVKLKKGRTLCRIYKNRLGMVIDTNKETGEKVVCMLRSNDPYDYEGCPLNTNKPLFERR